MLKDRCYLAHGWRVNSGPGKVQGATFPFRLDLRVMRDGAGRRFREYEIEIQ